MTNEAKTIASPSDYAQRLADALEANRKEQAGHRERLAQLQDEEAWLINKVHAASPVSAEAADGVIETSPEQNEQPEPLGSTASAEGSKPKAQARRAVPKPRRAKAAQAKTRTKKAAASQARATAKKTAAKPAAASKTAEPPLHKLVLDILLKNPGKPHLVREVHEELTKEHPQRGASEQVVRNSLETLWRKKVIDKRTQKRSAMYSAPATDTAAAGADRDAESENKPVPAEV
ncbi:hypothetical protein ACH4UR_35780 [Streptomyces lydicus]|uniref:hypothetical protein n=1 Tax=Streptomyces lydicus TaxID=47763 RepID=UPI0033FB0A60